MMRGRIRGWRALAAAVALCAALPAGASDTGAATAQHLFRPLRAKVVESGVIVLVPRAIHWSKLVVSGVSVERGKYGIELAFTADCDGATACDYGGISATRGRGKPLGGKAFALALGVTGHLMTYSCGASCPPAEVLFDYHGARYDLTAKESDAGVMAMANHLVPISAL